MPVSPKFQFRNNGFDLPLHHLQIISWVVLIVITFLYFISMPAQLISPWSVLSYTLMTILIALSILSQLAATYINPIHPNSALSLLNSPPALFDPSKHRHVIESNYCNICRCHVDSDTKHCRPCNKCVVFFDHHCRWLNNCVGAKNYKWFFCAVSTSMLASLMVFITGLLEFIAFYTDKEHGAILRFYSGIYNTSKTELFKPDIYILSYLVTNPVWLTIVFVTSFLALVASGLLMDLFTLHIYLCLYGLTTFRYLEERTHGRDIHRCKPYRQRRVTPSETLSISKPVLQDTTNNQVGDDNISRKDERDVNSNCHLNYTQSMNDPASHQLSSSLPLRNIRIPSVTCDSLSLLNRSDAHYHRFTVSADIESNTESVSKSCDHSAYIDANVKISSEGVDHSSPEMTNDNHADNKLANRSHCNSRPESYDYNELYSEAFRSRLEHISRYNRDVSNFEQRFSHNVDDSIEEMLIRDSDVANVKRTYPHDRIERAWSRSDMDISPINNHNSLVDTSYVDDKSCSSIERNDVSKPNITERKKILK